MNFEISGGLSSKGSDFASLAMSKWFCGSVLLVAKFILHFLTSLGGYLELKVGPNYHSSL